MIEYVRGELADLSPTQAVIDCQGVGYGLNISLATFTALQGKKDVKLFCVEVIREDAFTLWGFATRSERELFLLLNTVSGIGAATTRMILSALSPGELVEAISQGNERVLKAIKGIGPKAAQRIIVDLRDKVLSLDIAPTNTLATTAPEMESEVQREAIAALTMLGYSPTPAQKAVKQLLGDDPTLPVEQVIKQALKILK